MNHQYKNYYFCFFPETMLIKFNYVQFSITGADDVIAFNCDDNIYELEERDLLLKELTIRSPYDVVFLTTSSTYNRDFISKFLAENGSIIDTDEKPLASDEYGIFMRFLCSVCIHQKHTHIHITHTPQPLPKHLIHFLVIHRFT